MLQGLFEDLRYGLRVVRSSPGATAAAVLTLALGIAANTVVFGWTTSLLLHPFPGVSDSANLAAIETVSPAGEYNVSSFRDYLDIRDRASFASGMAASLLNAFNIGDDQQPSRIWGEYVTANYFPVLGLRPARGRLFSGSDFGDRSSAHHEIVISHRLWRTLLESDPNVVGRTIRVNREAMTVIGVAPEGFHGTIPGVALELWAPAVMAAQLSGQGDSLLDDRGQRQFWITARLKPGVSAAQANAELRTAAHHIAKANPKTNRGFNAELLPIWRAHFGAQGLLLRPLQILMAVAAVVFFIVIANVTNLQLARATARQKEFGIRLAMGAARSRLVRQVLTESLLLATMGAGLGFILSAWITPALSWLMPPINLPITFASHTDYRVVLFTTLLTVLAALLAGVAPALLASRWNVNTTLKESATTSSGSRAHRMRALLVVAEVALALVAIVATGLFGESFRRARAMAPGFEPEKLVLAQIHLATFCRTAEDRRDFVMRLASAVTSLPGVTHVSYADSIPLALGSIATTAVRVDGYSPATGEDMRIARNNVGPGFLAALGIPLMEGRDFNARDDSKSEPAAIVNQAFARRFFASAPSAIGRRIRADGKIFTVVGLAKDAKFASLTAPPKPYLYVPYAQTYGKQFWMAFFIRSDRLTASLLGPIRREMAKTDPHAAVADVVPYADYAGASLYPQKVAAILLTVLGVVSLALAAGGLYGVLSFSVAQRRREFGIRAAMGARRSHIGLLVLRSAATVTAAGIAIGSTVAVIAMPFASGLLVGVDPGEPMIFAAAAVFLGAVALLASYLPLRSATDVDPIVVLRE